LVIGDREKETSQVSVRNQKGEDLGSMSLDALLKNLNKEISDKS
jgi:threonyl-tRNA synthetase